MIIGIDIDNVISDFDDTFLKEYLKHDKELRNSGIINENADNLREMFDWTEQEEYEFYSKNIERIARSLKPIYKSVETIQKLKEDGNEIYIISGRDNGEYANPEEMTKQWLDKYEVPYDKLILTNAYDSSAKSLECKKNNVDIMIDDSTRTCLNLKENGIQVLTMNTRFNQKASNLERVSNWKEIYEKISSQYKNNKDKIVNK